MRKRISALLALCLLIGASQSSAQSLRAAVEACGATKNDADRLACYDSLLEKKDAPTNDVSTVGLVGKKAAPTAKEPEDDASTVGLVRKKEAPKEDASTLGLPKQTDDEEIEYTVQITKCQQSKVSNRTFFHLESGQVWKQLNNNKLRLRNCQSPGTITKGFFSYKLYIEREDELVSVERVR